MNNIIVIDGSIGSGKTSLCKQLERECANVKVCLEPVEKFKLAENNVNPLLEFYKNPKRYAYFLQDHIIETMKIETVKCLQSGRGQTLIFDRSIYSVFPFIDTLCKLNILSATESRILERKAQVIIDEIICAFPAFEKPILILLKTPIPVCIERIKKRKRAEEVEGTNLNFEQYLALLQSSFDKWFSRHDAIACNESDTSQRVAFVKKVGRNYNIVL